MRIALLGVVLSSLLALPAQAVTVHFSGTVGECRFTPGCEVAPFAQPEGRAFTGSFTYDGFAFPADFRDPAAVVSAFTVTFAESGLTLTADRAALYVMPHDARRQAAFVVAHFPLGTMGVGLISTELPPRLDLLDQAHVTWDCRAWGACGFRVALEPPTNNLSFSPAQVVVLVGDEHPTGTLSFTEAVTSPVPEPGTLWLLGGATLVGLAVYRGRQR